MPQSEDDERKADVLLKAWGHNPVQVRELAKLHRGLHWDRLLVKARQWSNTIDILDTALAILAVLRDGKRPAEGEIDELMQRIATHIDVLKRAERFRHK